MSLILKSSIFAYKMKRLWNTDLKVHRVLGVRMALWGEDNNKTPGWTISNLWMFLIVDVSRIVSLDYKHPYFR